MSRGSNLRIVFLITPRPRARPTRAARERSDSHLRLTGDRPAQRAAARHGPAPSRRSAVDRISGEGHFLGGMRDVELETWQPDRQSGPSGHQRPRHQPALRPVQAPHAVGSPAKIGMPRKSVSCPASPARPFSTMGIDIGIPRSRHDPKIFGRDDAEDRRSAPNCEELVRAGNRASRRRTTYKLRSICCA